MPKDTAARQSEDLSNGQNRSSSSGAGDSSFENVAKVTALTLSQTPSAFYEELSRDLKERPADVLTRAAGGAAIGAVGTVLLKFPKVATAVTLVGLGWQGYEAVDSFSSFAHKASGASTDAERSKLAHVSSQNLGRSLTNFTEAAPGMVIGGWGASKAFGAPPVYGRIGRAVEDKIIMPVKDRVAFIGPGTERLPASILKGEGKIDMLEVSRILGEKHAWKGIETGRTLDLNSLKLSRPVAGNETHIPWLPGSSKSGKVPFHTHGPESTIGTRPSIDDILATNGLGIIKRGDQVAFYVGHGDELALMQNAGKAELFKPGMRTVIVDHAEKTAQRLTGRYDKAQGWFFDQAQVLDYGSTLKALKSLDISKPWGSLEAIGGQQSLSQSIQKSVAARLTGG